ncbi:MAG: type III-B CRISPR module RAMP protein Cmr4 [Spirochaetales bacterium]|nr:type III-B CRISPR module RAMP protein Cmr4 [Spirochaetales bacterium]
MKNFMFSMRALSSVHCGVGSGANDIDLPTARHPVSGHPVVPGSSLKGVLKDEFKSGQFAVGVEPIKLDALFGADSSGDNEFASAISLGDAQLLALPVRSYFGTFAYLASPFTLQMFKNQRERLGETTFPAIPIIGKSDPKNPYYKVVVSPDSVLRENGTQTNVLLEANVLLEELDLIADLTQEELASRWAELLAPLFWDDAESQGYFKQKFAIVEDNVLNFLCETALPVEAHIAIDEQTGTVKPGALWYQESIPSETLFTGIVTVDRSFHAGCKASAEDLASILVEGNKPLHFQIGGKSTTGKGFVRLVFKAAQGGK